MNQSFRIQKLNAIRLTPLLTSELEQEKHKEINHIQFFVRGKARLLVFIWALLVSLTLSIVSYVYFGASNITKGLFMNLMVISVLVAFIPGLIRALEKTKRYRREQKVIRDDQEELDELLQKARNYQARMEISNGPGFLATYKDVIMHSSFESSFTEEQLDCMVKLSRAGRGCEIDFHDYGRLLESLKNQGIPKELESSCYLSVLPAQAANKAVFAIADLILDKLEDVPLQDLEMAALTGLHNRLIYKLPDLDSDLCERWDKAEKFFRACLDSDIANVKALGADLRPSKAQS